jgi:glycosyltransferase involved in cell wall biosynthesis
LSSCPGWLIGVALRSADVIVADGEEATRLLRKLSAAGPHVFASTKTERSDVAPFLKFQLDRTVDGTHRLAFSDDLAPQTGAADFLLAAMAWAGKHRGEAVDIVWIGDGILRDMLRAQPLPPNLSQRFISRPSAEEIADVFAQSGILVAPTAFGDAGHPVLQALAAGIPVLGSVHCRSVRQWVRDGETGWVFDPLKPGALNRAMSRALAAGATELDRMGRLARGDAEAATSATMAGRVRYAIGRLREAGDFDFATRRKFG